MFHAVAPSRGWFNSQSADEPIGSKWTPKSSNVDIALLSAASVSLSYYVKVTNRSHSCDNYASPMWAQLSIYVGIHKSVTYCRKTIKWIGCLRLEDTYEGSQM